MVAPSAFSKDASSQFGVNPQPTDTVDGNQITGDPPQTSVRSNSVVSNASSVLTEESPDIDTYSEQGLHETTATIGNSRKKLLLGFIMNPAVLSIITHFPNKCIPKKSEKYVVNTGMPISPPPSLTSSDLKSSNAVNNNNSLPKSSQSGKKRPSSKFKRYAGLLLAILSSMMFSFTGLIVKVLPHHHPLTQATWMFIGTVVVAVPLNILKYVYTYHLTTSENKHQGEENQSKSEAFKHFPDAIEPEKVIENPEGDTNKTDDIPHEQPHKLIAPNIILSEKVQMGLSSSAPVVVDLNPNVSTVCPLSKTALRQQQERRRKLKLFFLLLIRACSGCSGMILYFYSLKYLNVGDSLVIVCSSPIFVFIIGYLFLGESCGVIPVLTILLSMAGVAVITRPPMLTGKESFETEDMIGAGLAFGSMLCIAITIIMMRFLQNVYHGLINLVFGIWGSIQTTTLALAVGVLECPHNLQDAVLMSTTGVLFFLGQTFLAVSLQFEEAGPVSLVRTSEVVFAFLWQFIFLSVSPDIFSISGAGLILAGIFLTISRKWIAALPENSGSRKMFNFLLR